MKKLIFMLALVLLGSFAQATPFTDQLEDLAEANDDLGIRILLRSSYKRRFSIEEWAQIRALLASRPNVGYDLVVAWDRQPSYRGSPLERASLSFNASLEQADQLLSGAKYEEAFRIYQTLARQLKPRKGDVSSENRQLYYSILHQMGRALYSMKRYADAIEVYGWIPPAYFQIRQVMFEKMWAAFRGNRIDYALGTIASQQSAYFSRYLDPESYLIKIYIYKKLCREKDLQETVKQIKQYIVDIQSGKYNFMEWGRKDILRLSMVMLLTEKPTKKYEYISETARLQERRRVEDYLRVKFEQEKPILLGQLQKVLGYSSLAMQGDQKFLEKMEKLPDSKVLRETGFEYWPATDGEEWQDEIGSHVFIGESQCTR